MDPLTACCTCGEAGHNHFPIVLGVVSDLIEQGLVAGSQARPAGNITGMELSDLEIMGKTFGANNTCRPKSLAHCCLVDAMNSTHARVPGNIEEEGTHA